MRAVDIERTGAIWSYTPPLHKTAHHGHRRVIFLGPEAQRVVRPFLAERPLGAPLFSPRAADEERRAKLSAERATPLSCGNRPGTNRKPTPKRKPREVYTTESFGRAIGRACKRAGVPHWHPHQLRHARATELRRKYGIETARIILGHRSIAITDVYAELDIARARDVMRDIG